MKIEELIKCLKIHMNIDSDCNGCPAEKLTLCYDTVVLEVISLLEKYQRPQGEWIVEYDLYCRCPFCNFKDVKYSNYCPECGARLRRGEENA